jgi:hypothetical protein
MSKDTVKTSIDADGLRYRSKAPGSPFGSAGTYSSATMSCFLCGKHRARSQLKTKKLLGRSQVVCSPSCAEVEELLKSPA